MQAHNSSEMVLFQILVCPFGCPEKLVGHSGVVRQILNARHFFDIMTLLPLKKCFQDKSVHSTLDAQCSVMTSLIRV